MFIICINLKTKKLTYINDNDNFDELMRCLKLLNNYEYRVYKYSEFIFTIDSNNILDEVEKKYLWNIVKPFKNRVKNIVKRSFGDSEFIVIVIRKYDDNNTNERIDLPLFKKIVCIDLWNLIKNIH